MYEWIIGSLAVLDQAVKKEIEREEDAAFPRDLPCARGWIRIHKNHNPGFPFGVMKEFTAGYQVYVGGRWGKKVQQGLPLSKIITSEEEVLNVVEKAILLFRKEGITGERFADTVARLGLPYVEEMLLGDALLAEKDENLKQTVTGGASC